MKKTLVRDNQRKLFTHAPANKAAHSQSPTHKKLIKKIELTQREAPNQYDLSLQDDFFAQKPQEEVVDFRVEIERRFKKSTANSTFKFPLKDFRNDETENESDSSMNESFESIRHVTVYELNSQNFKRMRAANKHAKPHDDHSTNGRNLNGFLVRDREPDNFEESSQDDSQDSNIDRDDPNIPIEIRIQDKSSNTYKKFIDILEKQLNKVSSSAQLNPKAAYIPPDEPKEDNLEAYKQQIQPKQVKKDSKDKRPGTNIDTRKSNLGRDESQKSLGYYVGKIRPNDYDSKLKERPETAHSFQDAKKPGRTSELSQRIKTGQKNSQMNDTSQGNMESMMSLDSRISPSIKRTMEEANRVAEAKKKVNNIMSSNSILRSISPKYASTKNLSSWKEICEKSAKTPAQRETPFSPSTMASSLYQKAKDDVLSGKLTTSQLTLQKKKSTGTTQPQKPEKTDSSKSPPSIKGINFSNFYGSPKAYPTKAVAPQNGSHNIYTSLTKGRDIRNERDIGNKSSERQVGYVSYDIASKKGQTKPAFKLDLSNRFQKQKDLLSSNRGNQNKEKSSDMLSIDSILKSSYDMQNHSLLRTASSKTDLTKRKIGGAAK